MDLGNILTNLYLKETWSELWSCLDYRKAGPIHLPLYHLKSDGFWKIDFREGIPLSQPKSLTGLEMMVKSISLENDLISFIDSKESRDRIISALLNGGYYSEDERKRLIAKMKDLSGSFQYEYELIQQIRKKFSPEGQTTEDIPSRSSAFRRVVLGAYNETCAVCEMKLQTSSGTSIIDAAHILPFKKFHNDDIRNGLALCKMHHWLFDHGILSIDNHYRVLVTENIEVEYPNDIITRFHKEDVFLPDNRDLYPHPVAIEWHRRNVFE
jgi:putative restriction endonuclease